MTQLSNVISNDTSLQINESSGHSIDGSATEGEPSRELLAAIVNNSDDAILSKTLDGIITSWNPAAERLFGYAAEQIIGKPKTILFPQDRLQEEEMILERLRQGLPTRHFETIRQHRDGTPLHVSISISPIRNGGGQVIGASTIARDLTERKRVEALQQNHDRLAALLEAIPDAICRIDRNGVCLDDVADNRPYPILQTKIMGRSLSEVTPPHVAEALQRGVTAALATRSLQSLQYSLHIDGDIRYRDARIVPQSEEVAVAVVRDVTDTRLMEEALRESEARFQAFIDHGFLYAWITDSEGRIEYLNESYCAMIGRPLAECRGKSAFDLYPAEIAQTMLDNIRQVVRTGERLETVEEAQMPDGARRFFLVHKFLLGEVGGRLFVGGLAIDITARVEAERRVRDSNERQARIIDAQQEIAGVGDDLYAIMQIAVDQCRSLTSADQAIIEIVEGDELVYVAVSGGPSPHIGLRLKQNSSLSGLCVQANRLLTCDDAETDSRVDRGACRRVGVRSMLVAPLQKDGQSIGVLKTLSARPAAFTESDRNALQLIAGFLSASMQMAVAARDLRRNEEQLLQAQKMETIGQLAGGIAHDYNNLLAIILGYADLIEDGLSPDSEQFDNLRNIQGAANRAATVTQQLLAFARRQPAQPKVVALNDLLLNFSHLLRPLLTEQIELALQLDRETGFVEIDPTHLEQIIMNLAVNARDAMPQGGELVLQTSNVTFAETDRLQQVAVVPGEYVRLRVTDNGTGMTEEVKRRLFEPFFTTKEKGKCAGLGLATVYGLVKQSKGYIWVESEPGTGASFTVDLPRVAGKTQETLKKERPAAVGGTETLLVVEDESQVRDLTVAILRRAGYTVLAASNGAEALEMYDTHSDAIEQVVTDALMPRMGGIELSRRLRQQRPDLPILIASGYSDAGHIDQTPLPEDVGFLQKPFTDRQLLDKVRQQFDHQRNKD
jgi:two-component system cell cycle sensor histidine kinase/response regulator CckA